MLSRKLIPMFIIFILLSTALSFAESSVHENQHATLNSEKKASREMLESIIRLRESLQNRIDEKRKRLKESDSATEKENLSQELSKLDKQLEETSKDFERIATGVDTSLFYDKKETPFDWRNEVISLIKPGINEIKRLTLKTRKRAKLKDEIEYYNERIPYAKKAIRNISSILQKTDDPEMKNQLTKVLKEWKGIESQLKNKANVANLKLKQMDRNKKSLVQSSQETVKNFFRSKGLFIFIAFAVCISIVLLLRYLRKILLTHIIKDRNKERPFHLKAFELAFRIFTFIITILSVIIVFYTAEDWTLLSFTIIFLLGLGWAVKNTIPKLWMQSRLMLNIGPVREGERVTYNGIPWLVKDINFFTTLRNPDLDMELRIPIEKFLGMVSRPVAAEEPWFPCRKNDWVILSDGTRGKAVSISHEMVELVMRGGAHKIYQTQDFLSLSPLNISRNFRLKVNFGLSYDLQNEITDKIPETINSYLAQKLKENGYENHLLKINTEFEQAGASSLDLVVIADFKGEAAELYNRIKRAIQRWCVEVSTMNNWEIPFPQLTVHKKTGN